jgi:hypothetical protein
MIFGKRPTVAISLEVQYFLPHLKDQFDMILVIINSSCVFNINFNPLLNQMGDFLINSEAKYIAELFSVALAVKQL